MYNIYDVRLNANTHNFGGLEWVVDGERGRDTFPGTWAECTAREYYSKGWAWNHERKTGYVDGKLTYLD